MGRKNTGCHTPMRGATRMMTSAFSAVKAAPAYISRTARTTACGAAGTELVDTVRSVTGDTVAPTRLRRSLNALLVARKRLLYSAAGQVPVGRVLSGGGVADPGGAPEAL
jgi:hypothetical protein